MLQSIAPITKICILSSVFLSLTPVLTKFFPRYSNRSVFVFVLLGIFFFLQETKANLIPFFGLIMMIAGRVNNAKEGKVFNDPETSFLCLFMLMASYMVMQVNNFISIYVAIELQSICFYILVSLHSNYNANEIKEVLKYFIMSAFFSAFMLLGLSYIYGSCGSLSFESMSSYLSIAKKQDSGLYLFFIGMAMFMIGSLFKLSIAPFHFWAPDLYQSIPYRVIGIAMFLPKISFIFVLLNSLNIVSLMLHGNILREMLIIFSLSSIAIGSIGIIIQNNIKKFIAYSGISHMGFIVLISSYHYKLSSWTSSLLLVSHPIVMFYFISYIFASIPLILICSEIKKDNTNISDLYSILHRDKLNAFAIVVSILSMSGFPPTIGFMAKLLGIVVIIEKGWAYIAIIAILFSAVSIYGYLGFIRTVYQGERSTYQAPEPSDFYIENKVIIIVCTIVNLAGMFFPKKLMLLFNISSSFGLS